MSQSSTSVLPVKKNNIVRARVVVQGTRPLLQHAFGPESIALEKGERTGVAGNDPVEWKKTCMMTKERQLYIRGTYVFGCLRDAARHTKKGKGSIQSILAATLQIEESIIMLNRFAPPEVELTNDPMQDVYIDVSGVRNPSTKGRNVRYRLASSAGWKCAFTILWDKTLVSREQMRAVLNDASILCGLGDGRSVGNGRFEVLSFEELTDAKEAATARSVESPAGDSLESRSGKVRTMQHSIEDNGVPH